MVRRCRRRTREDLESLAPRERALASRLRASAIERWLRTSIHGDAHSSGTERLLATPPSMSRPAAPRGYSSPSTRQVSGIRSRRPRRESSLAAWIALRPSKGPRGVGPLPAHRRSRCRLPGTPASTHPPVGRAGWRGLRRAARGDLEQLDVARLCPRRRPLRPRTRTASDRRSASSDTEEGGERHQRQQRGEAEPPLHVARSRRRQKVAVRRRGLTRFVRGNGCRVDRQHDAPAGTPERGAATTLFAMRIDREALARGRARALGPASARVDLVRRIHRGHRAQRGGEAEEIRTS